MLPVSFSGFAFGCIRTSVLFCTSDCMLEDIRVVFDDDDLLWSTDGDLTMAAHVDDGDGRLLSLSLS